MNKLLEILILTILVVAIILYIDMSLYCTHYPNALLNLRLLTNLPGAVKCWDSLLNLQTKSLPYIRERLRGNIKYRYSLLSGRSLR